MLQPIIRYARALAVLMATSLALVVASCGGGSSSSSATTYASVAMAGELVDYTVDADRLTYTYTIVESQFGLQGRSGSGTLTRNGDGTYTPSGVPGARIVILPNGLLIGAVRENFGTGVATIPVIGLANPVRTAAELTGSYNYMHRGCLAGLCTSAVGTFVINPSGAWSSCPSANLTAAACPAGGRSGTLEHVSGGRWRVMEGAANVGTALVFASASQNVMLIDLKDFRVGGLGVGLVVGAGQQPMSATQTDGTWIAGSSNGDWAVFTTSGTAINVTAIDGIPVNLNGTFSMNQPWPGMATTNAGGMGFLAGAGVYVLQTVGGYAELGVRLR